jgi:hypothetical protein
MTDTRITSYLLGYAHGASDQDPKYTTNPDYMTGFCRGGADAFASLVAFCEAEGIALPVPTREPSSGVRPCPVATPTASEIVGGGKA